MHWIFFCNILRKKTWFFLHSAKFFTEKWAKFLKKNCNSKYYRKILRFFFNVYNFFKFLSKNMRKKYQKFLRLQKISVFFSTQLHYGPNSDFSSQWHCIDHKNYIWPQALHCDVKLAAKLTLYRRMHSFFFQKTFLFLKTNDLKLLYSVNCVLAPRH